MTLLAHERSQNMRMFMQIALGAFLLAASTGVALRFWFFTAAPEWAQNFGAIRHAHSHLMYFGWGTLALMALIWQQLPQWTNRAPGRAVRWQMMLTAVVALLSYPAFWSNGYGVTQVGSLALPLGAIVSGWNGFAWFFFAILYVRATRHLSTRPLPVQLWDGALILLLLASGGATGVVAMVALDVSSFFLQQTFLHLFLELFATGWFSLALLGLLWSWIGQSVTLPVNLPTMSLVFALAPTFFLGVSPALVPGHIFWISAGANAVAATLLAWHLVALWRKRHYLPALAQWGLMALGLHILIAWMLLWPGLWQWSASTQLRVFYLHNFLLGWVSSVLLGLAIAQWFAVGGAWRLVFQATWIIGIILMLFALLNLGLSGQFALLPALTWMRIAAWSSVVVALAIGMAFFCAYCSAGAGAKRIVSWMGAVMANILR